MFKILIPAILALVITNSCSVKNPFNKKNEYVYLDCPKILILYKAKSLNIIDSIIDLDKDLNLTCYSLNDSSNEIEIKINYNLIIKSPIDLDEKVNFWIFVTDKENNKLNQENFIHEIKFFYNNDSNFSNLLKLNFTDYIKIDKNAYFNGVKLYTAITL